MKLRGLLSLLLAAIAVFTLAGCSHLCPKGKSDACCSKAKSAGECTSEKASGCCKGMEGAPCAGEKSATCPMTGGAAHGAGSGAKVCPVTGMVLADPANDGYSSIFNGTDLTGWDGDPRLWSVRDGAIVGQTTPEKVANGNTFLIYKGAKLRDFDLKVNFKITDGNSGIQFRSIDRGNWSVSGYQAEVANDRDDPGIGVGFIQHEAGRGNLMYVGQFVVVGEEGKRTVVAQLADPNALKAVGYYKNGDWNEYRIVAQGNHIKTYVNGYLTGEMIDNDSKSSAGEGILALQIHSGPPMLVEYKNIVLKNLSGPANAPLLNAKGTEGWTLPPPPNAK